MKKCTIVLTVLILLFSCEKEDGAIELRIQNLSAQKFERVTYNSLGGPIEFGQIEAAQVSTFRTVETNSILDITSTLIILIEGESYTIRQPLALFKEMHAGKYQLKLDILSKDTREIRFGALERM